MKQLFWWLMVATHATWALYSAYHLAVGWASAAKRDGPWADRPNVPWPTHISQLLLFVVLGLLSTIILVVLADNDRWEQRLRKACQCDMLKCHCTIDVEMLYNQSGGEG